MSEASPVVKPHSAAGRTLWQSLLGRGEGRRPIIGKLMSGGLIRYQGNQWGHAPQGPFDMNNHQLGPGARI